MCLKKTPRGLILSLTITELYFKPKTQRSSKTSACEKLNVLTQLIARWQTTHRINIVNGRKHLLKAAIFVHIIKY